MSKKLNLEIFTLAQRIQIHNTSLRILKKVDIKINHDEIIDLLSDAGAIVRKKDKIAYLSENLIMDNVKLAGKKHIIYGRDRNRIAKFGYDDQFFMSSAGQYTRLDETTRERRPGTLKDTKMAILIGDALKRN